jgi:hypothetical protein
MTNATTELTKTTMKPEVQSSDLTIATMELTRMTMKPEGGRAT